jgi:hypothetical protein
MRQVNTYPLSGPGVQMEKSKMTVAATMVAMIIGLIMVVVLF